MAGNHVAFAEIEGTSSRKARGAFFTPPEIATFLVDWAVERNPGARVLDPTCGDGSFILAAARHLHGLGASKVSLKRNVIGIDIDEPSLDVVRSSLAKEELDATTIRSDFFDVESPTGMFSDIPFVDAVVGNPPFIRYQLHSGSTRRRSVEAALQEGVRLSGLASSWAAAVVHAASFLAPDGRLGMVLPAELLTVGYAEPIRRWLRRRFQDVRIVVVESLQFPDALEKVVLLLANGTGGCEGFSLYHVDDLKELGHLGFTESSVRPADTGKWTELLLRTPQRRLFKAVMEADFVPLSAYGSVQLGAVTGANQFFAISESTRRQWSIDLEDLVPIHPPGTKTLRGLEFGRSDWEQLRVTDERVWLLQPRERPVPDGLARYLAAGETQGIPSRYKCRIRDPWWRPPLVEPPDLLFTYMSHLHPRLVRNTARVRFLNSMHGVRLADTATRTRAAAVLPLLALNSLTLLGAELFGRSYGGGVLKMEPSEAAALPVPSPELLERIWPRLGPSRARLYRQTKTALWTSVAAAVDELLFVETMGMAPAELAIIREAAMAMRARRTNGD
jgi:adenine-specific DNA-methyltransferase